MLRRVLLIGLLLCACPGESFADELGHTRIDLKAHKTDNFVLFADEVTHSQSGDAVTARGNVQIVSEP